MEPALKQRLLGAAVLVALAVTFLPMLVMDPAPESGASNVSLKVPRAPDGDIETRELPLVEPAVEAGPALATVPASGAIDDSDGVSAGDDVPAAPAAGMLPAPTAGGDYAVSFGSYATGADAARVVGSLRASQLPGYAEPVPTGARTLHRVRIGPYAARADAEAARLRAAHVRDDVGSRVVVLDAGTPPPPGRSVPTPPRRTAGPAAPASPPATTTTPAPPSPPATQAAPRPAASSVGFVVQLGAFANDSEAQRLQDRARAAGFTAFVEPVSTERGTLHRVRIGPVADRADADSLRARVAASLGVDGIVRPHP